jgi:hypothetical protein
MAKKVAIDKTEKTESGSTVKVKGTHLFAINAEKFGDFLTKLSGRNLPHIVLVLNKDGIWVKQGCELKSRFISGHIERSSLPEWSVETEVEIPIGFIDRFRNVVKTFSGTVVISQDGENLVIQDSNKKFTYILVAREAIKNVTSLDTNLVFMDEENILAACDVTLDFLNGISKTFGLTDAKNINITFSDIGVVASVTEKNVHGMEMTHAATPTVLKKEVSAVYDGASFKEVVERLNVNPLNMQIVQNANGLKLLGFVESGNLIVFSNYLAPMVGVDKDTE